MVSDESLTLVRINLVVSGGISPRVSKGDGVGMTLVRMVEKIVKGKEVWLDTSLRLLRNCSNPYLAFVVVISQFSRWFLKVRYMVRCGTSKHASRQACNFYNFTNVKDKGDGITLVCFFGKISRHRRTRSNY